MWLQLQRQLSEWPVDLLSCRHCLHKHSRYVSPGALMLPYQQTKANRQEVVDDSPTVWTCKSLGISILPARRRKQEPGPRRGGKRKEWTKVKDWVEARSEGWWLLGLADCLSPRRQAELWGRGKCPFHGAVIPLPARCLRSCGRGGPHVSPFLPSHTGRAHREELTEPNSRDTIGSLKNQTLLAGAGMHPAEANTGSQ